jgi:hypothetical protein
MNRSTRGSTATSGRSTAEQAKEQVRDTARMAQDKAGSTLDQARTRLREQVGQRSAQAGDQVNDTARDLRGVAEHLRGQGKEWPARLADQLADRVESFGGYLRGADGERLLHDVETFARRQPWAMVAGGLTLGFVASRFLKASSSRRYQVGHDWSDGDQRLEGSTASDYHTEAPYARAHDAAPVPGSAGLTPER